jgi:hypothetical protein
LQTEALEERSLPRTNLFHVREAGRGQDHHRRLPVHRVRGGVDQAAADQRVHQGLDPLTRLSPCASQP